MCVCMYTYIYIYYAICVQIKCVRSFWMLHVVGNGFDLSGLWTDKFLS